MPCVGILGVKVVVDDLPDDLYKLIFENEKVQLEDFNLKIYTIKYKNLELDVYINSYEDYIFDSIYIIYECINSNKDKNNYWDNVIPFCNWETRSPLSNWIKSLEFLNININDIGFYVLEE